MILVVYPGREIFASGVAVLLLLQISFWERS